MKTQRSRVLKSEVTMNSDWANMPKHLLDLVVKGLVGADFPGIREQPDYLRFSVVCKSWYGIAMDNNQDKHPHPLLLIPTAKQGTWNIYDPMNDKVLNSRLKLPRMLRICGYSKGWLIAWNHTNMVISLINPRFRVKGKKRGENSIIRLPPFICVDNELVMSSWYNYPRGLVTKATISADPIINPNDCIVGVIYEGALRLAFIRITKDTTWTFVDILPYMIQDVISVEGKFYALDADSRLFSFDSTSKFFPNEELTADKMKAVEEPKMYLVYLNEKQQELLMVKRHFEIRDRSRWTTKVQIFEMDFHNCKWREKKTLGDDLALFLGDNYSIPISASKFSTCQANCIYFSHDFNRSFDYYKHDKVKDFGMYNVETQIFSRPYTGEAETLMKKAPKSPIWVLQTFGK